MPVSAMRAKDNVLFAQMSTNRSGNCFLADIRMARSVNEAPLMAASEFFFRLSDDLHCSIETKKYLLRWEIRHRYFKILVGLTESFVRASRAASALSATNWVPRSAAYRRRSWRGFHHPLGSELP